jgi:hypothetical protein
MMMSCRGIFVLVEDFIHEGLAEKVWVAFRQRWLQGQLQVLFKVRLLLELPTLSVENATKTSEALIDYVDNY